MYNIYVSIMYVFLFVTLKNMDISFDHIFELTNLFDFTVSLHI